MAFGSKVTDFAQSVAGYYGYIIKMDVTSLLMHKVNAVQAQKDPDDTFAPVIGEVKIETLGSYLNEVNCPRLAFNYSDGQVTVFFKGTGENIPVRVDLTSYAVGDVVLNTAADGAFVCVTAGITAAAEPTMSLTANTTDGTVEWSYVKAVPIADSFPYVNATRLSVFGTRKAQDATADGDTLDFPDKDLQLVLDYALQFAWRTVKKTVPRDLKASIAKEESRIRQD